MKLLLTLLKNDRLLVVLSAGVGLISGLFNAKIIQVAADQLPKAGDIPPGMLPIFAWLVLGVFATGVVSRVALAYLSQKFSFNLRLYISGRILKMSLRKIEEQGLSNFVVAFTQDVSAVSRALLEIPQLFINAAITFGCLAYLGFLSPAVMLFFGVFLVVALVSYLIPEKFAVSYMSRNRQNWDEMLKQFQAMTDGVKELKLHYRRSEAFFRNHLSQKTERVRQTGVISEGIYALLENWAQLIYFLCIGSLLFVVPAFHELTPAVAISFSLVFLYVIGPISTLVDKIPVFRRADIAFKKMAKLGIPLGDGDPDPFGENDRVNRRISELAPFRSLELRELTHTFFREQEDGAFTLGPVNLTVKAGQICFILGGNGSGKTTLAKLLTGLYVPDSGEIYLNGELVDDENRMYYRQRFSAIFSDFFVFETIMGLDHEDLDARARDYLDKLYLSHKVRIENGVLSTTDLSAGQRKRLALLTAYLEDRPIYLFDEWASDQDPEFKELFYRQLLPELREKGKTVFVISHDDRYFDVADLTLKLSDGRMVPVKTAAQKRVAKVRGGM